MSAYRKAIILCSVLLAGCIFYLLAIPSRERNVWHVLVGAFPEKISVDNAHISSAYYILRQTHEPLLRKDDGQNYTSRILERWSHKLDYSEYEFCPKERLRFDDATAFTKERFYEHISTITRKYDPGALARFSDGCATVNFKAPAKGYLEYLTQYENAPTKPVGDTFELGLGPFFVLYAGEDRIELVRKRYLPNAYTSVVLHLYKDVGDPRLQDRDVSDFNLIPSVDMPGWVKDTYQSFDNVELKTANLIINHPDPAGRRLIRNCLGVDAFRRAYSPRKTDFVDVQTLFPIGLTGAMPGLPKQSCDRKLFNVRLSTPIIFLNNRDDNDAQMAVISKEFGDKTGVPLNVIKFPVEQMRAVKRMRPRPYNLIVIVIDATSPDHGAFFGPFLDPSGYQDFDATVLRRLNARLTETDDLILRKNIAGQMIEELERQSVVLPLYQVCNKLYYPRNIKNINVGRGFLQYPEVAEFRL